MPKLNKQLPKYRLHKASGKAIVTLHGRDIYLGPFNSRESRKEYERQITIWLARRTAPDIASSGDESEDRSISEIVLRFLDHADTYYVKEGAPTGEIANFTYALKPLVDIYGPEPIAEFTPTKLKTIRQKLIQDGLCRNVINSRINRIRHVIKWAVGNQFVPSPVLYAIQSVSPLKAGRSEAKESKPVEPVDDIVVAATMAACPPTLRAMILVHWLTGMRPNELVQMRPCDIAQESDVWKYRPSRHKVEHHGIDRIVFLGPIAQSVLAPLMNRDSEAYLFDPRQVLQERYAACPTHRKKPNTTRKTGRKVSGRYTTMTYARAISHACESAGIPHWFPNQLRHAAATRIRDQGGLEAAQVILGHKHLRTTEIYAKANVMKGLELMKKTG